MAEPAAALHRCWLPGPACTADPNQRSRCPRQLAPAHLAARWGHAEALGALRRGGADLAAACAGRDWTPLREAEEWRRAGCVRLLRGLAGEEEQQQQGREAQREQQEQQGGQQPA